MEDKIENIALLVYLSNIIIQKYIYVSLFFSYTTPNDSLIHCGNTIVERMSISILNADL